MSYLFQPSLFAKSFKHFRLRYSLFIWICLSVSFGCVDDPPTPQVDREGELKDQYIEMVNVDLEVEDAEIVDLAPPINLIEDMNMMSCSSDEDCTTGLCEEGVCVLECETPNDCGRLQDCQRGVCTDRCFGPGTCFRGGVCLNGICVPEQCAEDDDCPEGRLCRGQLCVLPEPCTGDDECNSWERCLEGNCESLSSCGGDLNCAADEICQNGRCEPRDVCTEDQECSDEEDCIAGRCVPSLCRGTVDCVEGEICEGGVCLPIPVTTVDRVVILNTPRSLIIGQQLSLRAVALDREGQIISSDGFDWETTPNSIGQVTSSGLFTAGPDSGEVNVRAIWRRTEDPIAPVISDPLLLPVLPEPPVVVDGWRVRVSNGSNGVALANAEVYVEGEIYTTDDEGIATFNPDGDQVTCTIMADGFDTVTIVGITERALYIPLKPLSDDSVIAGFTGEMDFSDVRNMGQVEIGLAGGAFADGISHISVLDLIGQLFFTEIDVGPISATIPLPGGLVLNANVPFLGDFELKSRYSVIAQQGFQLGWSFAGRISLTNILGLLEGQNINVGRVLSVLLPFFDQFAHGVQIIPELSGNPPVADVDDLDDDGDRRELIPDYQRFPEVNLRPDQDQNLRLAVRLPPIFEAEGSPVALVLTGVDMVDVGFIPLGLSATQEGGLIPMRMAPPYRGLQAGDYTVLALSARFNNRIPRDISGLMQRFNRLPEQVNLADSFMALPEFSEWEPAFRRLTPELPEGSDLLRVSFRGGVGRWVIYFGSTALETIRLPFPQNPETPDLTVGLDVRFDALDLTPGLTLDEIVGEGGRGDLLQLDQFTERFSRRVDNGR